MRYLIQVLLLLCIGLTSLGQPTQKLGSLVATSPLKAPQVFQKPHWEQNVLASQLSNRSTTLWRVITDRTGVKTTNGTQLETFTKCLVIKENDDYLYLVEDKIGNDGLAFNTDPQHYGWVNKKDLILWENALYGSNNFRVKIMTTSKPESIKTELERLMSGGQRLPIYNSPYGSHLKVSEASMFEIYYVLKRENKRLLISKIESLERKNPKDYVIGWIDEQAAQIWEQRQVLQPNINPVAVKERQTKGVKVSSFSTTDEVVSYQSGVSGSPLWSRDDKDGKIDPYWMRMPVFKKEGDVVSTAVISELYSEGKNGVVNTLKDAVMIRIKRMVSEAIERRRNVNLVFLVDGTNSMGPYFQSVKNAVSRSVANLKASNSENNFKFGAMVYRDYVDADNADCYEAFPLNPDVNQFSRFINSVDTQKPGCANNTVSEGLFLGFKKLFTDVLRGQKNATNIIILVGDTGDRSGKGRITPDKIIPYLVKYQASVMALQVHMKSSDAYEDFQFDINDMMETVAKLAVNNLREDYKDLSLGFLGLEPRWSNETGINGSDYFKLINSPLSASMQCARPGSSMEVAATSAQIEDIIMDVDRRNDQFLKEMGTFMIDGDDSKGSGNFGTAALILLKKSGLSDEEIALLTQKNFNFLMETKTTISNKKLNGKLYDYQLFLDQREIESLINDFSKLKTPGLTGSKRREHLVNTWKSLLRTNYGIKDPSEIEGRSIAEIIELMTGLPTASPLLSGILFQDIPNINKFSDRDFDRVVNGIQQSMNQIQQRIISPVPKRNNYMFMSNGNKYFWIPQSYLP